jgi:hypothetical protein
MRGLELEDVEVKMNSPKIVFYVIRIEVLKA